ncbi:hypothetical protein NCCP133_09770 [Cytobacillus sp. NCCP-133]|nr:hypothetical protein NCCP133_09770 [Cytobacillus sp. NCCP-133]
MGKKRTVTGTCELCLRNEADMTLHHLAPKEMGGTFLPIYASPSISSSMLYTQM